MNLSKTRISHQRAASVRPPDCRNVTAFCICREKEHVAVPAGCQHNCVSSVRAYFTGHQVANYDSFSVSVDDDDIEHLGAREHSYSAGFNLLRKRLISSEQQLLTCLPARIKSA